MLTKAGASQSMQLRRIAEVFRLCGLSCGSSLTSLSRLPKSLEGSCVDSGANDPLRTPLVDFLKPNHGHQVQQQIRLGV